MAREQFDFDPETGLLTTYEDLGNDGFALHYSQDTSRAVDINKTLQNLSAESRIFAPDVVHYAHVPDIVALKWYTEKGIKAWEQDHATDVQRMLDDPDWSYLKTTDMKGF